MEDLVDGRPDGGHDGHEVDDDPHQLAVVDQDETEEVKEDNGTLAVSANRRSWTRRSCSCVG